MVSSISETDASFIDKLSSLSGQNIRVCFQCSQCTASCPISYVDPFNIRRLIRALQLGLKEKILRSDDIWKCTMCYECYDRCPNDVNIPKVIAALRKLAIEKGIGPKAVLDTEKNILELSNVWGLDEETRELAIEELKDNLAIKRITFSTKPKAKVVYFPGCLSLYLNRAQGIASAIVAILDKAKENWTFLEELKCCGHPLILTGAASEDDLKKIAEWNVSKIEESGAKRLVTGCPGCLQAFKNEYPKILGRELNFEVIHFVQLLSEYLFSRRRRIPFPKKLIERVTYHDPCELGRVIDVFNEPREILQKTKVVSRFVESEPDNLRNSRCCGAGGFLKSTHERLSNDLADERLKTLIKTRSGLCVTACPSCKLQLMDTALRCDNQIKIMDIAELVAKQLKLL
ncbi:MAG: (Fe-S)-binding protein, partial [Promethearchaeota archaeon]